MPYGPVSAQTSFGPSSNVVPDSPAVLSHADTGIGKMTVTVSVPVCDPPVNEIALFYSLVDISAYSTDRLFQLVASDGNVYKVAKKAVAGDPLPTQVDIPIESLAPGQSYKWVAAASN